MAKNTRQVLAAAFKRLLDNQPLEKITVTDIAETCGLNRQTFYYYFHDIRDLIDWILREETAPMRAQMENPTQWKQGGMRFLTYLHDNGHLTRNLCVSVRYDEIMQLLSKSLHPGVEKLLRTEAEGMTIDEDDFQFLVGAYTDFFCGFAMRIIMEDDPVRGDELVNKTFFLIDGSAKTALKKFAK